MDLHELKQQQEQANSILFKECGLFFAFSNEQFAENKTPLKEGEKYVSILGGGYVPKGNLDKLLNGLEANRKAYQKAVKANNLRLKQIAYEFANHECFYTGDWSVVADMFPEVDRATIERLYRIEHKKHLKWCKATGN
jgi:hypothetical protein